MLAIMPRRMVASGHLYIIFSTISLRRDATRAGSLPSLEMCGLLFMSFVPAKMRIRLGRCERAGSMWLFMYWTVLPFQPDYSIPSARCSRASMENLQSSHLQYCFWSSSPFQPRRLHFLPQR